MVVGLVAEFLTKSAFPEQGTPRIPVKVYSCWGKLRLATVAATPSADMVMPSSGLTDGAMEVDSGLCNAPLDSWNFAVPGRATEVED